MDFTAFTAAPRLSDGAWGTQLQQAGLAPGETPELWNLERPDAVRAVARAYVAAGCDAILTNTFGGNRFRLGDRGLGDRVAGLIEAGVRLSREAAEGRARVVASVGPSGRLLMNEDVTVEALRDGYAEAVRAIVAGGADAIVLETFEDLDELRAAIEAARGHSRLPVVACMTFSSGPQGLHTMMGVGPSDLAALATELGVAAVGANCGVGPDHYVKVARALRAATALPIWMKPNAGLPRLAAGAATYDLAPESFAEQAARLFEEGATIVGGCCGTTPAHLAALRRRIDAQPAARRA